MFHFVKCLTYISQRRSTGDVDFNRGWEDFVQGFGESTVDGDFWLGLEHIYNLCNEVVMLVS